MEQFTWIFLGCIASGLSAVTLFSELEDILGGLMAAVAWALWALGATNLEYATDSGQLVSGDGQAGIAFFGAGMAAVMILIMFVGAGRVLDVRNAAFDPQER